VDDTALAIAEAVRPTLVEDGMFLVGLDIAGDRLMEINVFSPGGLVGSQQLTGLDFAEAVTRSLEQKVQRVQGSGGVFRNREVASRE
jgi:glutathione synthase